MQKKKILVYTDSRGQHTPRGVEPHKVFAERLTGHPDLDATIILCPMKWTTTLDFLEYIRTNPQAEYDHIILFTGIVEWSPRPQKSAKNDLYNNINTSNENNSGLNTRDYSKKVVNNKKRAFERVFGKGNILPYLNKAFDVEYEGQPTINMYGLDHAKDVLLPELQKIDNLIFINSNRFVPGWEGDYTRGRPENISVTEEYSQLFFDVLGPEKTINLLDWEEEEVKKYTCDNLHLTKAGSDWVYEEVLRRIGLSSDDASYYKGRLEQPERLSRSRRAEILKEAGLEPGDKLASLVIGCRFPDNDPSRARNLLFLLEWIDYYYGDLFEVLLVEQDIAPKMGSISDKFKPYVKTEFLYNPADFNRGWGYNVAIKHLTNKSVVSLMDTDVLTGKNFVDEILNCFGKYKAISPYSNIYFTNEEEASGVRDTMGLVNLKREDGITKPTTIAGGVVIIRRDVYLDLRGFEQYTGYGGEDRALDVVLLATCKPDELRVAPYVYAHMHHPIGKIDASRLKMVLEDLSENFGCFVTRGLGKDDNIHQECKHIGREQALRIIERRQPAFADPDLYKNGSKLTIIGQYEDTKTVTAAKDLTPLIFPETFDGLDKYAERELYKAKPHDSERIANLYNKFKGERCFIIGNGPSLNKHDLALLKNEYSFGVNSFYYKTKETGFTPTFFVVEDNAVMKDNAEEIRNYDAPYKFFPTNYRNLHPDADNTYFFKMNRGFYEKSSPYYCVPRFSADASKMLYCGQSVTYINLQLAFFMGFTEVYLIGMDFDYVIPDSHERRGDLIISTTDDPNHFHKDYFGAGKIWKDPKLDRVGMNYRQAKTSFEAVGRKIYNATVGGKLEIFDRVDYYDLLNRKSKPVLQSVRENMPKQKHASTEETNSAAVIKQVSAPKISTPSISDNLETMSTSAPQVKTKAAKVEPVEGYSVRGIARSALRFTGRVAKAVLRRPALLVTFVALVIAYLGAVFFADGLLRLALLAAIPLAFLAAAVLALAVMTATLVRRLSSENRQLEARIQNYAQDRQSIVEALREKVLGAQVRSQRELLGSVNIALETLTHSLQTNMSERLDGLKKDAKSDFDEADYRLSQNEATISQVMDAFEGVEEQIGGVKAELKSELDLHNLRAKHNVSQLQSELGDIRGDVSAFTGQVAELDAQSAEARSRLTVDLTEHKADLAAFDINLHKMLADHDKSLAENFDKLGTQIEVSRQAVDARLDAIEIQTVGMDLQTVLRSLQPLWGGATDGDRGGRELEVEHGHYLLMSILTDDAKKAPDSLSGKTLIEVGTTREFVSNQRSTHKLSIYSALQGINFITVDMDPSNTARMNKVLRHLNPAALAITRKGEEYLPLHKGDIDYVYLDAFDFYHENHSQKRVDSYKKNLSTAITDEACWKMHLECARVLALRMQPGGVIVIDDTWIDNDSNLAGKGRLAVPYLEKKGFEVIAQTGQAIALRCMKKGK